MVRHKDSKTQISKKFKEKTIENSNIKKKNDDKKKSAIPKFITSTQKTSSSNKNSIESSPTFVASKSLSPIREKFISKLISPRKEKSPEKKSFEKISNESISAKRKLELDKSRNISRSNINKSRRKSLPKKRKVIDENTGVQSIISHKIWKEIKHLQLQTKNVIPVAPFLRLVKEILMEFGGHDIRVQRDALAALQEACELYMTQFMQDSYLCTIHAKRVTLMIEDMQLARRLRGTDDIINH